MNARKNQKIKYNALESLSEVHRLCNSGDKPDNINDINHFIDDVAIKIHFLYNQLGGKNENKTESK